jgi:hypothetical protein
MQYNIPNKLPKHDASENKEDTDPACTGSDIYQLLLAINKTCPRTISQNEAKGRSNKSESSDSLRQTRVHKDCTSAISRVGASGIASGRRGVSGSLCGWDGTE